MPNLIFGTHNQGRGTRQLSWNGRNGAVLLTACAGPWWLLMPVPRLAGSSPPRDGEVGRPAEPLTSSGTRGGEGPLPPVMRQCIIWASAGCPTPHVCIGRSLLVRHHAFGGKPRAFGPADRDSFRYCTLNLCQWWPKEGMSFIFRTKVVVMNPEGGWSLHIAGRWSKTGGVPFPTDTNLKTCWRFCTTALRQKLTRLHCSVGVSSMAFCQWALRSTT
jgi:hypothetical protein